MWPYRDSLVTSSLYAAMVVLTGPFFLLNLSAVCLCMPVAAHCWLLLRHRINGASKQYHAPRNQVAPCGTLPDPGNKHLDLERPDPLLLRSTTDIRRHVHERRDRMSAGEGDAADRCRWWCHWWV